MAMEEMETRRLGASARSVKSTPVVMRVADLLMFMVSSWNFPSIKREAVCHRCFVAAEDGLIYLLRRPRPLSSQEAFSFLRPLRGMHPEAEGRRRQHTDDRGA